MGDARGSHRIARRVAVVAGLLGTLMALATPLLPVTQTTARLDWPQAGTYASVEAPLIGYSATDLTITVPCQAAAGLAWPQTAGATVLLSTVPKQAPKASERGLLIMRAHDDLVVVLRDAPLISAPLSQVLSSGCRHLTVTARADGVTAEFVGLTRSGAPLRGETRGTDARPQIVGVFSDLTGTAPAGLRFTATLDTRYSTRPTPVKVAAMILGAALTVVALIALHVLDRADGRRNRRVLPRRWWSFGALDALVVGVLAWWHVVGANTSDDGYILTMARVSERAGYTANYYRWYGTPEAPFGWYYDLLAPWSHVSTASVWMRLPTLVMALACWWVLRREVLPRLGHAVATRRAAAWTAAGMFLAVWLPLDNGLRPEPIIALGILLTWCSVERAVATGRLLPVAVACITGALTLLSGPTGIASIGALLVAVGPLRTILRRKSARFGVLPLVAPLAAAATVTAILIFRDQTLAGVVNASTLKRSVGPSRSWFDEHLRYDMLFTATPDGSIARRFAVLTLILALGISVAVSLRKGRIPGTAAGPGRRVLGITIISFLAMMFTPTKWTHHFGVFAGLAGAVGALAAVAVTAMPSRRNRTLVVAAVLFVVALSFASVNGWWYVADFGVPWAGSFPKYRFAFATLLLGLTVLALLLAARSSGADRAGSRGTPTFAVAAWALVVFEVASLTVGMVRQYPAWSVGRSNLQTMLGADRTCGLADDVLVELDPGALAPVAGSAADALGAGGSEAFAPNGIPAEFRTLPFNLDPARTPVLGSWQSGAPARLQSGWYRLPARTTAGPLLVVSAAGRFDPGEVQLQWSGDDHAAAGKLGGTAQFADIGGAPAWRNLRLPLAAIPAGATSVRLVVDDGNLSPEHWIALTPPRVPRLRTLQDVVGSTDPVFLDWEVGLAFPCQRPFGHRDGVDEVPGWRILPGRISDEVNSPVMDSIGGGPLGVTELLLKATTVATYLKNDWSRDWGSLQRFTPYDPGAQPAHLQLGTATRSGLWSPGPLRSRRGGSSGGAANVTESAADHTHL